MTEDDCIDPRVSISKWKSSCTTVSILAIGVGDIRTLERLYSQRWYSTPIDETKRENRTQAYELPLNYYNFYPINLTKWICLTTRTI